MMTMRKYLTWPLCLLFAVGIGLSGYGGVLCLGDDGYAKVELFCQPRCDESVTACVIEHGEAGHDHPDNCTDLPLIYDSLAQQSFLIRTDVGAPAVHPIAIPNSLRLVETAPRNGFLGDNTSPPSSKTVLLSITVLLC